MSNCSKKFIEIRSDACRCHQVSLLSGQHAEALATVEAYRAAFEEQLDRNRSLVCDLARLATPGGRGGGGGGEESEGWGGGRMETAKAAVRFLVKTLHDGRPDEGHHQGHPQGRHIINVFVVFHCIC